MTTHWIDSAAPLQRFCQSVGEGPLAVDTESDHYHAYNARVCLIQIATEDEVALVDPLRLNKEELTPLFSILGDKRVPKILHAGRNDIVELHRDYGAVIENLIDTEIAARFAGYRRSSLSWLLEELFDIATGPNFQRFDWRTRPLPQKAVHYGAQDVVHLFRLARLVQDELEEQGWSDAFAQQCGHAARTARHEDKPFDPQGWRRLKGTKQLDGAGRSVLEAVFAWRHRRCEETNQAAFMVLSNRALIKIAKEKPGDANALRRISGVAASITTALAQELVQIIGEASSREVPARRLTAETFAGPSEEEQARFDRLRRWRNATAKELDLPSEFIATNSTLSALAKHPPLDLQGLKAFTEILPWQQAMLGPDLVEVLRQDSP